MPDISPKFGTLCLLWSGDNQKGIKKVSKNYQKALKNKKVSKNSQKCIKKPSNPKKGQKLL